MNEPAAERSKARKENKSDGERRAPVGRRAKFRKGDVVQANCGCIAMLTTSSEGYTIVSQHVLVGSWIAPAMRFATLLYRRRPARRRKARKP